jgi:hypothetical protein
MMPMHGLLDVDETEVRRLLGDHQPPLSMTGFVIAAAARAVAAHPEVHAYRDWRGRLVRHRHVDVQTLVEVATAQGAFGLVHVVRDADVRGVADISAELRGVQSDMSSVPTGRALQRLAPLAGRVPGAFPAMHSVMRRSVRAPAHRNRAGDRGGDVRRRRRVRPRLVHARLRARRRRGVSRRPRVLGEQIAVCVVLDLTSSVDHDVVDGAPATRFGADLRRRMESPATEVGLMTGP